MVKASEILTQILFGGRLEDKLAGADIPLSEIEWDHSPVALPEAPGREGVLSPRTEKKGEKGPEKHAFPKRSELKQESTRGKLLHFFANHELLAIETMAYTLLKFPDAPIDFKRGVMKTIQDEQRHMGLYLSRMHDYGVDLGGVPLNLYFWNILKTMQTPLDFVTRMSLTFEQANLDFALEYAKIFEEEIADEKTAKLLRVVHDDEVKHVAHGLKWFNEWRNHGESEFESYQKLLPFPLTPRRGKGGKFFSAESRKEAGFSDDYVLSMKVAGGSRGRVPDYFFFNPHCEMESFITLNASLKAKVRDIAPLMIWLAHEADVLELPQKPDLEWMNSVFDAKGELPEIVIAEIGAALPKTADKYVAFEELRPWGWGPSAWNRLSEIENRVRKKPAFSKNDPSEKFFSKAWWKSQLIEQNAAVVGEVLNTSSDLGRWLETSRADDERFLLKSAVSTSGRGHLEFSGEMLKDPALISKIQKRLQDEALVIEPLLKKRIDFSVQYEILANGEVKSEEPRLFLIDSRYQYQGALLGNWGPQTAFEVETKFIREQMRFIRDEHQKVISILKGNGYVGPFGIDSLIYEEDSEMKIAPLIEVNVRYTMGRVANEIEKVLERKHSRLPALWTFMNRARVGPEQLDALFSERWMQTTPFVQAQSTWTAVIWDDQILTRRCIEDFLKKC